jgi:hypothetical protein
MHEQARLPDAWSSVRCSLVVSVPHSALGSKDCHFRGGPGIFRQGGGWGEGWEGSVFICRGSTYFNSLLRLPV